MEVVKAIILAAVLFQTADVPPEYGAAVYHAATHHEIDFVEAGAILIAENKGRRYDPTTRGSRGEIGLFQIVPLWGVEATERCHERYRDGDPDAGTDPHHRYAGMPDCLWIDDRLVSPDVMEDPLANIETAMVAISYMQAKHAESRATTHWLARYRCDPDHQTSPGCRRSVARVLEWVHVLENDPGVQLIRNLN